MEEIKFFSENEALKEAERLSEEHSKVIHIIKSDNIYYLDEDGIVAGWETLIATFENGKQIFS